MVGFCLDNLLQHGYIHHNQNTLCGDSGMPYVLILDPGQHLSTLLDMTFTEDEGSRVAVNCFAVWSFTTSLMASAKLCGPFS